MKNRCVSCGDLLLHNCGCAIRYGDQAGETISRLEKRVASLEEENANLREWRRQSLNIEMRLMALHNEMQDGSCVEVQYIPNHAGDLIRKLRKELAEERSKRSRALREVDPDG